MSKRTEQPVVRLSLLERTINRIQRGTETHDELAQVLREALAEAKLEGAKAEVPAPPPPGECTCPLCGRGGWRPARKP